MLPLVGAVRLLAREPEDMLGEDDQLFDEPCIKFASLL